MSIWDFFPYLSGPSFPVSGPLLAVGRSRRYGKSALLLRGLSYHNIRILRGNPGKLCLSLLHYGTAKSVRDLTSQKGAPSRRTSHVAQDRRTRLDARGARRRKRRNLLLVPATHRRDVNIMQHCVHFSRRHKAEKSYEQRDQLLSILGDRMEKAGHVYSLWHVGSMASGPPRLHAMEMHKCQKGKSNAIY